MKANKVIEAITDKVDGFTALYVQKKNGEHLGFLISLGRVFPTAKSSAKKVAAKVDNIGVLYNTDVEQLIEPLLQKHGLEGEYKLTKSGRNCRLVNTSDFAKALKLEYNF